MFEFVAETGSTNADLARRIRAGEQLAEGHWLIADRQSAGRGRQGRDWRDGAGNFMGSTVVHRRLGDPPAPTLALVTGLALYDAVFECIPRREGIVLKWPNDLLMGGAKVAGILLEGVERSVVIGVGVNLVAAPDLADRRTAALAQFADAPSRDSFAAMLADKFASALGRWRHSGLGPTIAAWHRVGIAEGTPLAVHEPGGAMAHGTFVGLADDGALRLRLGDGTLRVVHAGDVLLEEN